MLTTGGHYAYLKIAEGLRQALYLLHYPQAAGALTAAYPWRNCSAEARELAEQGVKELILVAQETTLYGVDLYGEKAAA